MKAIQLQQTGGPEVLQVRELAKPSPKDGEVLIKVAAAGINYADLMLRQGNYMQPTQLPKVPGFEVAGTVESVGVGAEHFKPGTRVTAMISEGGYAEYALASAKMVVPLPDSVGFAESTALWVQGITAYGLLKNFQSGQTVLIHAAAGGLGSIAVQLAQIKGAKTIIGTTGSKEKMQLIGQSGAKAVDYSEANWTEKVKELTSGKGVDLLLEMVGGEIGSQSVHCVAPGGRMIIFGSASGEPSTFSSFDLFKGITLSSYTLYQENPEFQAEAVKTLMQYHQEGKLTFSVQTFPLEKAAAAHQAIADRKSSGKLVLTVG